METVQDAQQLFHIKTLRGFLWILGGWPEEILGRKLPFIIKAHRLLLPSMAFVVFVGITRYLIKARSYITFLDAGHNVITIMITLMTIVKTILLSLNVYETAIKSFLCDFHLLNYKKKDEYYKKVYSQVAKYSNYITAFQCSMVVINLVFFNVTPFYKNLKMGAFKNTDHSNMSLEYAVNFDLPGFVGHFYVTTFSNIYFTYNSSVIVCCLDLLVILMLFQIIGHMLILKHQLESIARPQNVYYLSSEESAGDSNIIITVELFNAEENKNIHNHLIEMVKHHTEIIRFSNCVSSFYGPILAITYLFCLLMGCILLLELSSLSVEAILRYGIILVIIFGQIIELSSMFEIVNSTSESLIDAVYCVPWECMDVRNQRSLLFFLSRIQIPIQVTAMGMVPVGVKTMLSVFKAIITYYAMLKSLE